MTRTLFNLLSMEPFPSSNQAHRLRSQKDQGHRNGSAQFGAAALPGIKHHAQHAHPSIEQAYPSHHYLGMSQTTANPTNCTTAGGGHVTTVAPPGRNKYLTPVAQTNQRFKAESPAADDFSEDVSENAEEGLPDGQTPARRSEKKARAKLDAAHLGIAEVLRENGRCTSSGARADNMNELVKFSREIVHANNALRQRVMQLENSLAPRQQPVQDFGAFPQTQPGPLYHVSPYNYHQGFGPGSSGM